MATPNSKRMYGAAFIGCGIRRTIGKTTTYRLRRGNGRYGAELGVLYQDKFARVVPSSINNTNGEPYRAMLRAAVAHWQYALTADEKAEYNRRARILRHLSGYNLFLRQALKGEIEMYVDRGDPATYDWILTDLIEDGAWHELDLSAIVPAGAKAILMRVDYRASVIEKGLTLRKLGNVNARNSGQIRCQVADVHNYRDIVVACDADRKIEYHMHSPETTLCNFVVRGWWT